ncbi:hypothetical protein NT6N_14450 [Oceaniferula spumae]|uniref:Lipoprotein n=1 Tax=Oceaniferula spumae TaxID=2979115 RepID=A0AAT9FKE3_9BACT
MRDSQEVTNIPRKFASMSLTLTSCVILASCSNFSAADLAKKSVKSVSGLIPSRMPIAEVRPGDLKKMPTGADRALAWERHLNKKQYVYNTSNWVAPKNYKAPTLPEESGLPADGGLLPPLHPGQGSALDNGGSLPD